MSGSYGTVFQMCFTDPNQGTASAQYIKAHSDLGTKIAIIYKNFYEECEHSNKFTTTLLTVQANAELNGIQ